MFRMLKQFFDMLTTLFHAGGRLATAADHLAGWSEESAEGFVTKSRLERNHELSQLQRQHDQQTQEPLKPADDKKAA